MPTIDDVIGLCEEKFKRFKVTDENREKYRAFLERQVAAHPEYDLNARIKGKRSNISSGYFYVDILREKLLLFSYMLGETEIITDNEGSKKKISCAKDLVLLSCKSIGYGYASDRTDEQLYRLLSRMQSKYVWSTCINELGRDEAVLHYFSRTTDNPVTYGM